MYKKVIQIVIIILMISSVSRLKAQYSQYVIAVVPFKNISGKAELNNVQTEISEQLLTWLAISGRLTLVERSRIDAALEEEIFTTSGQVDETRAAKFGRKIGATLILTGTFTSAGNTLEINARLFNVESGKVGDGFPGTGKLEKRQKLVRKLAAKVEKKLTGRTPKWAWWWPVRHPEVSLPILGAVGYGVWYFFIKSDPVEEIPMPPDHPAL